MLENIEPEDEVKQNQGKQIESLHIGRVRKKSGNKTSAGKPQKKGSKAPLKQSNSKASLTNAAKNTKLANVQKGSRKHVQNPQIVLKAMMLQSSEEFSSRESQISSS